MRILHVAAGAGAMYCGACARDVVLVRGLRARGHDVDVVPLYTPLRIDGDEPFPTESVFLGGINVYLQDRSAIFRRIPPFLDRILDSSALLKLVSRFAIDTRASELGEMTVSVLAGREGRHRKEFDRLLRHLDGQAAYDVVVLTNTMLSALAPELKRQFGVPIICELQGEDAFVGAMREPHRSQAQELMRENARAIDLLISPGERYAQEMADFLALDPRTVRVVRTGLPADDYRSDGPRSREPFTVGYLSGISRGKGLDVLVEAWWMLVEADEREVALRVAGRVLDKGYWDEVRSAVRKHGLDRRFEYCGEVDFAEKLRFLRRCSVFCVPSRLAEARGTAAMEAMAAGVPAVVPQAGVFPEMLSLAPGGVLFAPEDPAALAAKIAHLMDDPEEADRLGRDGAAAVGVHYGAERAVEDMLATLEDVVGDQES
ncbi:MAG: glycosyltransferase family 4 protein [Armatimonadota bacterium]